MANYDPSNDNPYARLSEREMHSALASEDTAKRIKDLNARIKKAEKDGRRGDVAKAKRELDAIIRAHEVAFKKSLEADARERAKLYASKHSVRPTVKATTTVFGSDMFIDGTPTEISAKMAAEKEANADRAAHLLEILNNSEATEDSILATFVRLRHPTLWEELNVFSIVSVALDRRFSKFLEGLHKYLMESAALSGSYYKYISKHVIESKKAELDEKIRLVAEACGRVSELMAADAEAAAVAAAKAAERAERTVERTVRATITPGDSTHAAYAALMTKFAEQFGKDKTTKGKQSVVLASLASGTMPPSTILTKKMREEVATAGLGDMLTGGRRTMKQRTVNRKERSLRKHRSARKQRGSLRRQRAATRKHRKA